MDALGDNCGRLLLLAALVLLSSCAAFKSSMISGSKPPSYSEGLEYHLPKKDILLSVTVADSATPGVAVTDAYPDLTASFLLNYSRGLLSKNEMVIAINEKGLITSATATMTSSISDIAAELAKSMAAARSAPAVPGAKPPGPPACSEQGTYTRNIDPFSPPWDSPVVTQKLCDYVFTISRVDARSGDGHYPSAPPTRSRSGVFYRQLVPYRVTAAPVNGGMERSFLAFIPDALQANYLKIPIGVFADASATLTFVDGMPTGYSPKADSEVLAAAKIPANVISEYFGAVGSLFEKIGAARTNEAAAGKNKAALMYQQWKAAQCAKALATGDASAITAACE